MKYGELIFLRLVIISLIWTNNPEVSLFNIIITVIWSTSIILDVISWITDKH